MVSMLIVVCKRCNSICLDILIYFCAGHKFYDLCNRLTRIRRKRFYRRQSENSVSLVALAKTNRIAMALSQT